MNRRRKRRRRSRRRRRKMMKRKKGRRRRRRGRNRYGNVEEWCGGEVWQGKEGSGSPVGVQG